MFAFIGFNIFMALSMYWLFRVANLTLLTSNMHKTKKDAKAHQGVKEVKKGVATVAAEGAHPGGKSEEQGAGAVQ